jgi:Rrf2 family cysteine metabolism transcriptional repressor
VTVSAKGEYAIKAMLDLALTDDGETLQPIQDIARRQGIPQRYLEQVLLGLKRAGFLHSRRGSAGGYRLAKARDQITVGALLRAVEGRPGVGAAGRPPRGATGDAGGDLTYLWRAVSDAVDAVVDGTTLEDLKRHAAERRASAKPMYHI